MSRLREAQPELGPLKAHRPTLVGLLPLLLFFFAASPPVCVVFPIGQKLLWRRLVMHDIRTLPNRLGDPACDVTRILPRFDLPPIRLASSLALWGLLRDLYDCTITQTGELALWLATFDRAGSP